MLIRRGKLNPEITPKPELKAGRFLDVRKIAGTKSKNTENRSLPEKSKLFQNPNCFKSNLKSKCSKSLDFNHLKLIWNNLSFGLWISKTKDFFKTFKSRIILKKALALATIVAVIVTAYLQNTPRGQASNFTL